MSSEQIAIQVSGLSKHYQIYQKPEDRLKQYVLPGLQRFSDIKQRQYFREFKALDNISFEVRKGEAVGIIGRNGAGKSTLLQIICGTLTQTSGDVVVNGTVAALLELGSGFKSEFTGRENVYMNASLLGLSSDEIDEKFNEIAEFADIGDYIEQPTKTYSSGMRMRLAFAVNTCVEPDILIVDEALGVGDAPFQSKCFKRLRKLIERGTTILFVSHDISTVRSICGRALWLKQGRAESWGDAKDVAKKYEIYCWEEQGITFESKGNDAATTAVEEIIEVKKPLVQLPTTIKSSSTGTEIELKQDENLSLALRVLFEPNPTFEKYRNQTRMGTGAVVIRNFLIVDAEGHAVTTCEYNDKLDIYYLLEVCEHINSDFIVGFRMRDIKGNYVYSANDITTIHRLEAKPGDFYSISTQINVPLTHQNYVIHTSIFGFKDGSAFTDGVYDFTKSVIWDVVEEAAYIKVSQHKFMPLVGPVNTTFNLNIRKIT